MELVYTHPSHLLVAQARNALERLGIPCVVHNEYAAGAAGELAPIDTWPELWVRRSRDAERARLAIERAQAAIEEYVLERDAANRKALGLDAAGDH